MNRDINKEDLTMDSSIQHLLDYAESIHPNFHLDPADLLPTGKHPLPDGFTLVIDAFSERVTLFGPAGERGERVPHAAPWGNGFKILGLDLLRALTHVLELGEPSPKRTLDERRQYFLTLLATAAPFAIPAPAPMTRSEMERHIDACEQCRPVSIAYGKAIDAGASLTNDAHVTALIGAAHADPAAATAHYLAIADGRNSLFTTSGPAADKARTKRTAQPDLTTAGKES